MCQFRVKISRYLQLNPSIKPFKKKKIFSYSQGLSYAPNVAYIRNPPKDFRMGAILSAIFCFFPLGLLAIYYSFRVSMFSLCISMHLNKKKIQLLLKNIMEFKEIIANVFSLQYLTITVWGL